MPGKTGPIERRLRAVPSQVDCGPGSVRLRRARDHRDSTPRPRHTPAHAPLPSDFASRARDAGDRHVGKRAAEGPDVIQPRASPGRPLGPSRAALKPRQDSSCEQSQLSDRQQSGGGTGCARGAGDWVVRLAPRRECGSVRRLVPPGLGFATIGAVGRWCPVVPRSSLPWVCVDAPARLSWWFAHASGRPVPLTQDVRHARNSGEFWKDHNLGRLAHRVEVPNEEHQRCLCERAYLVREDS